MTPEAARADRNESIRTAAWAWRAAGVIGDGALAAVEAAYPDDRRGVGPVFQVLLFLFTSIAISGAFGFFLTIAGDVTNTSLYPILLFVFGGGLVVATEFQITDMKRTRGGVEVATSLAGIGFLAGFAFWIFDKGGLKGDHAFAATLFVTALLLAGAAWRWGYPLYAGAALAAFLGGFIFFPGARVVWIAVSVIAAPILARFSESPRLPPSHRASCTFALGVALAALYGAVNLVSFDLEGLSFHDTLSPRSPGTALRWAFVAATALVPVIYLAIGLHSRRYVFLVLGAVTGVASLATLRYYVHLAPLWVVLILSGAALVALVFALRRYLDSGAGKERHGYTAEPLFEEMGRRQMLEAGAAVLSLSPEARPIHEEPKFAGGGGSFGGGGASGEF